MRRRSALLIRGLLFSSLISQAQNCKYLVNEKDPLTDDIIRTVKTRLTGPTPFYYFSYVRNGSDFKFKVEVGDYGELNTTIAKDSELVMRAGNGTVIRMKAVDKAVPEIIDDYGNKITKYVVTYQMSEEDMKHIADSGIKFIRIKDMKNTFSDQEIPTAVVEISKSNGECIFR